MVGVLTIALATLALAAVISALWVPASRHGWNLAMSNPVAWAMSDSLLAVKAHASSVADSLAYSQSCITQNLFWSAAHIAALAASREAVPSLRISSMISRSCQTSLARPVAT